MKKRHPLVAFAVAAILANTGAVTAQTAPGSGGDVVAQKPSKPGANSETLRFGADIEKSRLAAANVSEILFPEIESRLKKKGLAASIIRTEKYNLSGLAGAGAFLAVGGGEYDLALVDVRAETSALPLLQAPFHAPFTGLGQARLKSVMGKILDQLPEVRQSFLAKDQVLLALTASSEYVIVSKSSINTFDDLKGKKIGVAAASENWLKNTGAVAVVTDVYDLATNLKSGVLDGAILPAAELVQLKLIDNAKFVTLIGMGAMPAFALTFNKQRWDNLPGAIRDAVAGAAQAYEIKTTLSGRLVDGKIFQQLKAAGATISDLGIAERKKWAGSLPDSVKNWIQSVKKNQIPATRAMQVFLEALSQSGATPLRKWMAGEKK